MNHEKELKELSAKLDSLTKIVETGFALLAIGTVVCTVFIIMTQLS